MGSLKKCWTYPLTILGHFCFGMGLLLLLFAISLSAGCSNGSPICEETCKPTNEYWRGLYQGSDRTLRASSPLGSLPHVGDVVLIIQIQGGLINNTNDSNYGSSSNTGNGFTDVGNAGRYEFASVTNATISSGIINITVEETLQYTYSSESNGRFQVVRVPLCRNATINEPSVPPWDGSIGGVFAVIAERVFLGNISLQGKGFRGGPDFKVTTDFGSNPFPNYRDNSTTVGFMQDTPFNGPKGEGFVGYPRFPLPSSSLSDTTYPEGFDCGRGAPGNAGGGGSFSDAGGGGGANGGRGGDGRYPLFVGAYDPGLGGAPAPSNGSDRLFLGKPMRSFVEARSDVK